MTEKDIKKQLKELRAEMRLLGIRKISPFNGGLDRTTQQYNEQRFALETGLERLQKQ
jgi:hypothetical protein